MKAFCTAVALNILVAAYVQAAETAPPAVRLGVNVKNSGVSGADFNGAILGPDGATIASASGIPEQFAIPGLRSEQPADYNYVVALSFGPRYEQYYINIRDVHYGKLYNWNIDGAPIDLAQRSSKIQSICGGGPLNIERLLQRYTYCRAMYFSYAAAEVVSLKFLALKGWFDASVGLASMPSSLFSVDPELVKLVKGLEAASDRPAAYRTAFAPDYVDRQLALAKQSQLADIREIQELLKVGDSKTALKINDRSTSLFKEIVGSQSASTVVNGVNSELLAGNKQYLDTLTNRRPDS